MGEWALFTDLEKDALADCACSVIGDKAKLLIGISDIGMPNILRNMERWAASDTFPLDHQIPLMKRQRNICLSIG